MLDGIYKKTPPDEKVAINDLLSYQDSNLDKQAQNLLCYHYTIRQCLFETAKIQKNVTTKKFS